MRKKPDQKWVAEYRNQGTGPRYQHGRIYLVRIYVDEDVPDYIPQSGRAYKIWWDGYTHWDRRKDRIARRLRVAQERCDALNADMLREMDHPERVAV